MDNTLDFFSRTCCSIKQEKDKTLIIIFNVIKVQIIPSPHLLAFWYQNELPPFLQRLLKLTCDTLRTAFSNQIIQTELLRCNEYKFSGWIAQKPCQILLRVWSSELAHLSHLKYKKIVNKSFNMVADFMLSYTKYISFQLIVKGPWRRYVRFCDPKFAVRASSDHVARGSTEKFDLVQDSMLILIFFTCKHSESRILHRHNSSYEKLKNNRNLNSHPKIRYQGPTVLSPNSETMITLNAAIKACRKLLSAILPSASVGLTEVSSCWNLSKVQEISTTSFVTIKNGSIKIKVNIWIH